MEKNTYRSSSLPLVGHLASSFCALLELAIAAKITFTNNCSYTVWPGIFTGSQKTQLSTTGFELAIRTSKSVSIPSLWSGRIWARTGCSNDSGIFVCVTGDCGTGQVGCNGAGATLPATFAELTTTADGGLDFYDVSNVDGFNLPMSIAPNGGNGSCKSSSCPENITSNCPEELQVRWSDGNSIACKSACLAFNESRYCCTGSSSGADECSSTSYSLFFSQLCPIARSYAYDDINFTCSGRPDYVITFCPHKSKTASPAYLNAQDSPADYLNAHNAARSQVGVAPLTWDNDVAAFAQNYANQRKGDCQLIRSGGGGRYGENLAWSSAELSGAAAVQKWVDEKADYVYNTNACAAGKVCRQYTQVVWRNSVRVGCAKVRCDNGGTFISCNYDPAGNIVGQRPY